MKKHFMNWLYKNFGKTSDPSSLDWFLVSIMALLVIIFVIAMNLLIINA